MELRSLMDHKRTKCQKRPEDAVDDEKEPAEEEKQEKEENEYVTEPTNTERLDNLQESLKNILPKELIGIIFEYKRILWNPYQLKCQNKLALRPTKYSNFKIYVLSSTCLISKFGRDPTSINRWNLKYKRIENSLDIPGITHIFFIPHNL